MQFYVLFGFKAQDSKKKEKAKDSSACSWMNSSNRFGFDNHLSWVSEAMLQALGCKWLTEFYSGLL